MKAILTGLAIIFGCAVYAQQTADNNAEAPTGSHQIRNRSRCD